MLGVSWAPAGLVGSRSLVSVIVRFLARLSDSPHLLAAGSLRNIRQCCSGSGVLSVVFVQCLFYFNVNPLLVETLKLYLAIVGPHRRW